MASDSEKLDFTSERFDAIAALTSNETKVPVEEVQTFSSLSEFFNVVTKREAGKKSTAEEEQCVGSRQSVNAAELSLNELRELRRKRLLAMTKRRNAAESDEEPTVRRPQPRRRNVLTAMDSYKGPLGMLYKCMKERIRVKIWTRSHTQIRGICTGFILAFDHHWNLALSDVEETFALSAKAKIPAIGDPNARIREVQLNQEKTELSAASEGKVAGSQTGDSSSFQGETDKADKPLSSAAQNPEAEDDICALTEQLKSLQHQLSMLPEDEDDESAARRSTARRPVHSTKAAVAATLLRGDSKMRIYERHVNQIFLRGDNIVLIAILEC